MHDWCSLSGVCAGGMDYVVGGADADHQMSFLNSAEKFNKETHTWASIEPMNLARREAAAVMVPLALIDPQEAARRYAHTLHPVLQDTSSASRSPFVSSSCDIFPS